MLEEDAVIAVLLCENSVTLKHGSYLAPLKIKDNSDKGSYQMCTDVF